MSILERALPVKALLRAAVIATGIGLAACTVIPYQEMSDARQAIDAAEPVAAERADSRALLNDSRTHLDAAEKHLKAGEYELAREHADKARDLAIEAREAGENATAADPADD